MNVISEDQRQRLPTEERREHLIEIAEALCAESGPHGLKLREVARRAGVSAPAIYNHFSSLEDLLAAVVSKHLIALLETYEEVAVLPPDKAIEDICRRHVRHFATHPGAARLFQADLHTPKGHRSVNLVEEQLLAVNAAEAELIVKGIKNGLFRDVDPGTVMTARIGIMLTLLAVKWLGKSELTPAEIKSTGEAVAEFVQRYLSR